ncbi:phosphatase 2C-like domain-containing protein [Radiomyces spectabilis]|uniref:phosphatase 2C-like domain-containing protein n=1 Tax=Radiomyces spectabilis TaxID=64574 RepID=UPI0022211003|nr:phosphatase 2C-like domain-containing protein [Radiomyces spectabilis]KAI8381599.1 phosphatase 2C-like domain-containing protein [Radiomyces spectabilis]
MTLKTSATTALAKQLNCLAHLNGISCFATRTTIPTITLRGHQQYCRAKNSRETTASVSSRATHYRSFSTHSTPALFEASCTQRHYSAYHIKESTEELLFPSLPVVDFFANECTKSKPSYVFAHGASGFAKRGRNVPYPSDDYYYSVQIGEDAYFRRPDALGVADGVGGWKGTKSANPALYSRNLMHHAYLELEKFEDVEDPRFYQYDEADPVDILERSYEECMQLAEQEGIVGSCTACLAILRHDELRIANLGDCGISVIRHNNYIFRSEEQQHSFNFPYQLGTSSPDRPKDAQTFTIRVEKGDIVILGSDGLYDNLFDREILSIVCSQLAPYTVPASGSNPSKRLNFEPQRLSDALADNARLVSENRRHVNSPFQNRAMKEGFYFQGGKADDISVIVAVVKDCEDSPDRRL